MSPRRTRRGTVREDVSEMSVDSSIKSSSKSGRKTRRYNKSEHVKSSEEDSDAVNESSQISTKTPSSRRNKKNVDQTLNETNNTSLATKNDSKVSKAKKPAKSRKKQESEVNSTASESEGLDTKNETKSSKKSKSSKSSRQVNEVSDNKVTPESSPVLIPPVPHRHTKTPKKSPSNLGSPKTHSRTALRSLNVPRKLTVDSPPSEVSHDSIAQQSVNESTSKSRKNSKSKVVSDQKEVTSPVVKVKSLKTAMNNSKTNTPASNKKSPSKKVFSRIEKLVKINLTNSLEMETSIQNKLLSKSMENEQDISEKSKDSTQKLNLNSSIVTSSSNVNKSSSPAENTSSKLSLSTSKRKSKTPTHSTSKSKKSPKFVASFTPGKTPKIALSSSAFKTKKSPLKKAKSPPKKEKSLSKNEESSPKKTKSPVKKHANEKNLSLDVSMSPTVVLNKLTPSEINSFTPLEGNKSITIQGSRSPKSSKRPSLVVNKSRSTIIKGSKKSTGTSQTNTPIIVNKRISLLKPLTSSTPREKVKTKKLTLSSNINSKISKKLNDLSNPGIKLLEDESLPSMNNSSLVHLSAVYNTDDSENDVTFGLSPPNESSNKTKRQSYSSPEHKKNNKFEIEKNNSSSPSKSKKDKNGTYEVESPKTPQFQNKSKKRKFTEVGDSIDDSVQVSKKSCKVQFATPATNTRGGSSGIQRQGTPGHVIHKRTPVVTKGLKSSLNKSLGNRTSSTIKTQLKTPGSVSINKRLSVSLSAITPPKSNKSSQLASASRLSKLKPVVSLEKRMVTKTPAGKIPNFAAIHKKKFERMESLVDVKKRVEERHATLNAPTSSTKKVPSAMKRQNGPAIKPADPTNGSHNRFGWPVRKNEAVDLISKKQSSKVESSDKRREKARTALKGVRMNRRFELQMQSRMKNS